MAEIADVGNAPPSRTIRKTLPSPGSLTTTIDLDEGTGSLDLLEPASEYFALTESQARVIIKVVATTTATWRDTAKAAGACSADITRMASAFGYDDLKRRWHYDKNIPSHLRCGAGAYRLTNAEGLELKVG